MIDFQDGFRKGQSTEDFLTTVWDDRLLAKDNKLYTVVVSIDLNKTFDNVQHQKLLNILQSYNIRGNVLNWLYSYLQGRTQRILLKSASLKPFSSTKGVPQGSVLYFGPLLYNIYVSDLAAIASQCKTLLPSFADDMTMYCSHGTPPEACHVVSSAMSVLLEAITDKGIAVNNEKTVSMVIRPTSSLATSSASGYSDNFCYPIP